MAAPTVPWLKDDPMPTLTIPKIDVSSASRTLIRPIPFFHNIYSNLEIKIMNSLLGIKPDGRAYMSYCYGAVHRFPH
ncbi:predicted protein [Sclerotinia sclerotiorum 1980 UF-70]|uniref:Uncharacterized protein n=1 Tax=Sclerotinia sclerotiorum (strain ATCC 18683 / 1980 / Ss-1) TaxID=665079 RepID=A7EB26_SCLS1|nr:predicted protein [Sclerotinia sclerotiorum 1980 UF-70]EDN99654.1 predicted protein [Sclerotinia sclerotiorum 1980 UF-70]